MTTSFNWNLREYLHQFKGAKLPVLTALLLHSNPVLRSWPSIELLCSETGYGTQAVVEALKHLEQQKAIIKVPYENRLETEQDLPQRSTVYQLTGITIAPDAIVGYLNWHAMTEEQLDSICWIVQFLSKEISQLIVDILKIKILIIKTKDSTSLKGLLKDISPSGETSENTLSVEEAANTLFGTREEPVTPDAELLKPKFTTDQLKELANAYVNGYCPVGKYNRPICLDLLTSGYFKVRGRNTEGVTSYKLSATGKAVCSDPSTPLLDIIKQKQETQATIVARKEAAKDKPKKKKNGSKTPIDLSTRPEIEPIVQALCQIHFNSKYQDATDVNKQTLISLANIYRNQGADTAAKVHQIHDHYRKEDWYKGASPFGFTQKMRIMQALSNNSKNQPADKISKFNE